MISGISAQCMRAPWHVLVKLLCSALMAFCCLHFVVFFPPSSPFNFTFLLLFVGVINLVVFSTDLLVSV